MENQVSRETVGAALRVKYDWIVGEAYAYLRIIFSFGIPKDQQVALMAQVLADRGVYPIPEDAALESFAAIARPQVAAIDLRHRKRTTAFVQEIMRSNKPVDEVAADVIAFLEAFPIHEERVVVFARMLGEDLTPYVSIPEGLFACENEEANRRVLHALEDEKYIRADLLVSRIFREEELTNGRAALACIKILAGFMDQPDVAAALLFRIGERLWTPEPMPDIHVIEVRGGLSFLKGLSPEALQEHTKT